MKYAIGQTWFAERDDMPDMQWTFEIVGLIGEGRAVALKHVTDIDSLQVTLFDARGAEMAPAHVPASERFRLFARSRRQSRFRPTESLAPSVATS